MSLLKILPKIFPKTCIKLQSDAVKQYSRLENRELLSNALAGYTFYVRGDTNKDGWHELYKFTPENMGRHKTALLSPTGSQKVYWKNGKPNNLTK